MNKYTHIENGVCAPIGFTASGIHCGIRKNREKKDLSLIYSECDASAACVYTTNKVKGAPITVTANNLKAASGIARAIICNSGNANTCMADGIDKANTTCKELAGKLKIEAKKVIIASTGVIGQPLNVEAIINGIPELVSNLSKSGNEAAAEGIMTTDTVKKEIALSFECGGKTVKIGGMAKGSGMINPNMATLLAFVITDAAITPQMLEKAVKQSCALSYNMISVDGDTSTNDMLSVMANGMAENALIDSENSDYDTFLNALNMVNIHLARTMAKDGEGATKLIECTVSGAKNEEQARALSKSVISSSLVKAAIFGADANWGRILCAMGYSKVDFEPTAVNVTFASKNGRIAVCENGSAINFDEDKAKEVLSSDEIMLDITINGGGKGKATAWGCDLTYEYVKINGDYRT